MAQINPCDQCGVYPGLLRISNLSDGETLDICPWCVPSWAAVITQAVGPPPTAEPEAPEAPEAPDGALVGDEATEPPEAAPRPRKRASKVQGGAALHAVPEAAAADE